MNQVALTSKNFSHSFSKGRGPPVKNMKATLGTPTGCTWGLVRISLATTKVASSPSEQLRTGGRIGREGVGLTRVVSWGVSGRGDDLGTIWHNSPLKKSQYTKPPRLAMEAQQRRHKNKSDTPTSAQNDLLCDNFPLQFAIVQWQWCSPSQTFLILLFSSPMLRQISKLTIEDSKTLQVKISFTKLKTCVSRGNVAMI